MAANRALFCTLYLKFNFEVLSFQSSPLISILRTLLAILIILKVGRLSLQVHINFGEFFLFFHYFEQKTNPQ
jgi:hypothetical protein